MQGIFQDGTTTVLKTSFFVYSVSMNKIKGFSLLEVLVSWAILSFVLLGLADVLMLELKQTEKVVQKTLSELYVKETNAAA